MWIPLVASVWLKAEATEAPTLIWAPEYLRIERNKMEKKERWEEKDIARVWALKHNYDTFQARCDKQNTPIEFTQKRMKVWNGIWIDEN